MFFNQLRLINYRNFLDINLDFDRNINIFIGNNAQGKTNMLEALNFVITGKSYRTNYDKQLINWDNKITYLHASISKQENNSKIHVSINDKSKDIDESKLIKTIKINHNFIKRPQLNKEFKGVVFSPEHLQIIKGSPSLRRKFLNEQIFQVYPLYYKYLLRYNRILAHRNNILKKNNSNKDKEKNLLLWNSQLIEYGTFIVLTRSKFLKKINDVADIFHKEITENKESLKLVYQTNVYSQGEEKIDQIKEEFKKKIKNNKEKELSTKTTLIGPHRDDFLVYINQVNVAFYGSQGQQRTAILTLKLAEVDLIKERENMYPVLFLDDVMSELDEKRRYFLLDLIINKKIQTFITSISLNYFNKDVLDIGKIFKMEKGKATVL